jgi:hypothetical protein
MSTLGFGAKVCSPTVLKTPIRPWPDQHRQHRKRRDRCSNARTDRNFITVLPFGVPFPMTAVSAMLAMSAFSATPPA